MDEAGVRRLAAQMYDKLHGTPCEQIRHQQEVERLEEERDEAKWRADGLWNVLIRFLREIPPEHIPGDLYENGQSAIGGKRCAACNGRGMGEQCCGEVVSGGYWDPPECCGRMAEIDCPKCRGTGFARPDDLPKDEADDLPF